MVTAQVSPKPSSTHTSQQVKPYRPSASSNPLHMSAAGWLAHPYPGQVSARTTWIVSTRCLPSRFWSRARAERSKSA